MMNSEINAVDCVFRTLNDYATKRLIVEQLFENESEEYKGSWMERTPFEFWCRLDLEGQRKFIGFAIRNYRSD